MTQTERRRRAIAGARLAAGGFAALLLIGCDDSPRDLVDQIEAASAECTPERLKAGAEECVRMFERYAEMGADAMESYIGAMRAFDESVQRRGGMSFDTAGLGRALSDRWQFEEPSRSGGQRLPAYPGPGDPYPSEPRGWEGYDPMWRSPSSSHPSSQRPPEDAAGAGWSTMSPPRYGSEGQRIASEPADAPRRGVLLPPDQRLRRPWLEGDGREIGADPRNGRNVGPTGPGGWDNRPAYGMGNDPRYAPGYAAPYGSGYEPRYSPGYDPRFAPGYDPRYGSGRDPRMNPGYDPRYPQGYDSWSTPAYDPWALPGYDPRYPAYDPRGLPGYDPRYPAYDPRGLPGYDPRYPDGYGPPFDSRYPSR